MDKKKKYSLQESKEKIKRYCAYQERSHQEVKNKLFSYGLYADEVDQIIVDLITEGFLSEERFAKSFAGGKFRMKKWGRLKIIHALEGKGLSANCIKVGVQEIDDKDYEQTLLSLLKQKIQGLDEENVFIKRDKISKAAIQKGYEPELVWANLRKLLPD